MITSCATLLNSSPLTVDCKSYTETSTFQIANHALVSSIRHLTHSKSRIVAISGPQTLCCIAWVKQLQQAPSVNFDYPSLGQLQHP